MKLSPESIETIFKQAVSEYPSECCGIVTGTEDRQAAHPLKNIQEKLHAEDPETHPRTSREAYAVDRNEVEGIIAFAKDKGDSVLAFYHSHIDCGAYFSAMDKEVQTVFGEPEFPHALHVVVAVREGKIDEVRGFLWDGMKQDFIEVSVR